MTQDNARGLGHCIDEFEVAEVALVPWLQSAWRAVTRGNEGGITQGAFKAFWRGDMLMGHSDSFEVDLGLKSLLFWCISIFRRVKN